ncbi:MAG: ATP-binding cassette domain-containing protein [Leptospirales bacterium]|nr:ATP-binding cassette domain-containing protein [Leptospirales bacterium]
MSAATASTSLLAAEDIRVYYPVHGGILRRVVGQVRAVDGVSLQISPGEIVSVVGESGCGKSTLGLALLGLTPVASGRLSLNGKPIEVRKPSSWRPFRRDFQIVFQDPYGSLNPRHTVQEMLSEPLQIHKLAKATDLRDRAAELLQRVGLDRDYLNRYAHAFSGGQRQRLAIARALAVEPRLIVCDEIVAALDVSVQAQIVNLLLRLREEMGLALLFISHDLSLVRSISNRVHVMYLGRIAESATSGELFSRPRHPYTRSLLDSIPTLQRGKRPSILTGEPPSAMNPPAGCAFHTRCPGRKELCSRERPELQAVDGGLAACHFPLE